MARHTVLAIDLFASQRLGVQPPNFFFQFVWCEITLRHIPLALRKHVHRHGQHLRLGKSRILHLASRYDAARIAEVRFLPIPRAVWWREICKD